MSEHGERMKELRAAMGLSQDGFGDRIGMDRVRVSRIECGRREMPDKFSTWERMAEGLGVDLERLRAYMRGELKASTLMREVTK